MTTSSVQGGRALPHLPGWYESQLSARLYVLAHESGLYPPVYYRSVGWGRPQPFVYEGSSERRFGTISAACAFAEAARGEDE